MLQSSLVADYFGNLGYIIPIATIFGVPMLPRARFLQLSAANVIAICLSAAVNLLAMYTSIAARQNTATPPPGPTRRPAAVQLLPVCRSRHLALRAGVGCQCRAARFPSLNLPTVIYTILASTALSSVVILGTMTQAEVLIRQLLVALLVGHAFAMAVNLLVFPLSSRKMALGKTMQMMAALKGIMKAQVVYVESVSKVRRLFRTTGREGRRNGSVSAGKGGKKLARVQKRSISWQLKPKVFERPFEVLFSCLVP